MTRDLEWLPEGSPAQLLLIFHGVGDSARGMAPLAALLRHQFPQSAVVAADGFFPFDAAPVDGRQWFSLAGVTDDNRAARVAEVVPRLAEWIRAQQARLGCSPAQTCLVGFSQGSIMALETIAANDGLAGRVLAFAGRYAALPEVAPRLTTLHLLHGAEDDRIAADHARAAFDHLAEREGDVTLDIAEGVGHELHPALLECAMQRLTGHIPQRTWREAMGSVPARPTDDEPGHGPH